MWAMAQQQLGDWWLMLPQGVIGIISNATKTECFIDRLVSY